MPVEKKKVLLIDDSTLITDRLTTMIGSLENIGPVKIAASFQSALELISQSPPDIVVLDINLSGKNGIAILRHVKRNLQHIIVIMLSNQSGEYYKSLCLALGADYFLDKSIDFERVPEIISAYL